MSLVQAVGVARAYGELTGDYALKPTSLEIQHGEFVAIVGPSGCGKSTLMNILGLLDRPTEGDLLFEGRYCGWLDDDELADIRNTRIGFVFQQYHLLPRLSALRNVELPLVYAGVASPTRRRLAEAALEAVGMASFGERLPALLSGGEQQRIAVARAIVCAPSLLLADEPTGALDSASSVGVLALLRQLHASGMSVVMVTHDRELAGQASRIIQMRDGEIVGEALKRPMGHGVEEACG